MVINPHWPPLTDGKTLRKAAATIEYLCSFPADANLPFPMGIKNRATDIWLLWELYERKQTMWKLCRDFLFSVIDIYCSLCVAVLQEAHEVSAHAVLFTANTVRMSLVHLFQCRWRQFKLNVASMWQHVKLKGYICFIRTQGYFCTACNF